MKLQQPTMMTNKCGSNCWQLNGKLHRTDGPAVERANGDKVWYLNGKRHRTDGPAVEYADGTKAWYLNDKHLEDNADGFWVLWEMQKTDEQKATLLFNCGGIPK